MNKSNVFEEQSCRLGDILSHVILGALPEERFERLTRMAKRMLNIPIALVGLVEEGCQRIDSDISLSNQEESRVFSFSGLTPFQEDIVIIPDTLLDERFIINPLISGDSFIRFFAGCPLRLPNGVMVGALCILDVKPRKLSNEDINLLKDLVVMLENEVTALQLATLDELTQISNRRGFLLLAQKSLEYCRRNSEVASLIFFDLNDFKLINDDFGHAEGDKVLTVFADLMLKNIRGSDVFARLGGDEFVALLINTSEQGAKVTISKFQQSLDFYNQQANRGYDISFSYGIPEFDPERHKRIEDLLADGDCLMYECKKNIKKSAIK